MSLILAVALVAANGGEEGFWPEASFSWQDAPAAAPTAEEEKPEKMWLGRAWEGVFNAGLTITSGNTNSKNASADAKVVGRGEDDRWTFTALYLSGRQEDPVTGDEFTSARRIGGAAKYDYFFTKKWYGYGIVSAEKDGIRELDLLFNAGVGTGYQWVEGEERNLFTEVGVGFTSEEYEDETNNEDYLSARAALHYDEKIGKNATFFHDSAWLPSIESFNDDQIVKTVTGIRAALAGNFSLEAKVLFDWDSSPASGLEGKDVTYIVGVSWTF